MKPIEQFAEYNRDNILGNFLQAETHLKNLESYGDPDFAACVNKHLLESQMELSELTAHDPEHSDFYKEVMVATRKLRKDNINKQIYPNEAIRRLREIRGGFERRVTGHNVEDCKSCGDTEETIKILESRAKDLNRGSNKISNSIQGEELTMSLKPLIGSFVGKGISEATTRFVPGVTFGVANKTLINLGFGILVNAAALLKKGKFMPGKAGQYLVPAANFLIADEIGDLVAGYIPAAAMAAPMAVAAPAAMVAAVPQFANNKHVFVD